MNRTSNWPSKVSELSTNGMWLYTTWMRDRRLFTFRVLFICNDYGNFHIMTVDFKTLKVFGCR